MGDVVCVEEASRRIGQAESSQEERVLFVGQGENYDDKQTPQQQGNRLFRENERTLDFL